MPSSRPSPPTPGNSRRRPGPVMPSGWVWLVILAMAVATFWAMSEYQSPTTIQYSQFNTLLNQGLVNKVTVGKDHLTGELKSEAVDSPLAKELKIRGGRFAATLPPEAARELNNRLETKGVQFSGEEERGTWLGPLLMMLLPALLLLGVFFFFFLPRIRDPLGGSFLNNYIKSPARRYERNKSRV